MFQVNPILKVDSYKHSHYAQFPEKTSNTYYYGCSRRGEYKTFPFFGLQGFCQDHLVGQFCTPQDIPYAKEKLERRGDVFNAAGWDLIANRLNGRLPIRIKALKEGTIVKTGTVLYTCESTIPEGFWVPSWVETMLMRGTWYPSTVAARSYACKKVIYKYLTETADDPLTELPFKLHDFGARGVSSSESAMIGGAAHLINFKGTDTLEGQEWLEHHYGAGKDGCAGFSIPAMEHSTVLIWKKENEQSAYDNMLNKFAKAGAVIACVSDAYDYYNAVENIWCKQLIDKVRYSGSLIFIRPDSGFPPDVIRRSCEIITNTLGAWPNNKKGFTTLPSYFRLIQGDGNDSEQDIEAILDELKLHHFSASNVAFGMGGGLLQKLNRDTNSFAYKMSQATVDGEERDVCKTPKTDSKKDSMKGRFSVVMGPDGNPVTICGELAPGDMLETVFENGEMKRVQTLDEVRELAGKEFA